MSGARNIEQVVYDMLTRLENEGIYGVRAWFAKRPDIVVIPDFDGSWEVIMRRGKIMVKITLDKDYNVKEIKVRYD